MVSEGSLSHAHIKVNIWLTVKCECGTFLIVNSLCPLLRDQLSSKSLSLILVRHVVAFNECYCFAASLCVHLGLPFFLKSNPSFSLFPVLCGSFRAPHTLFLTVLNVFSLLCAACCSRKINRLINMRAQSCSVDIGIRLHEKEGKTLLTTIVLTWH